jgi:D-alanyl-lipoteichoic acid acyltransferase DltB (MBOAT superfamily)
VVGLWHGAAWNFVFWGIYHAIGMIIYQIYSLLNKRKFPKKTTFVSRSCSVFLTFNFVSFGWVLFKMTLSDTFQFWAKIFSSKTGVAFLVLNFLALLTVLFSPDRIYTSFFNKVEEKTKTIYRQGARGLNQKILFFSFKEWLKILTIIILFFFTLLLFSESTAPYVYEQF